MEDSAYYARLKPLQDSMVIRTILLCRDGFSCAFCGIPLSTATATADHLVPKDWYTRQGRPKSEATTWANLVSSCSPCNTRKANSLCEAVGMFPRVSLYTPSIIRLDHYGKIRRVQPQFVARYYVSRPEGGLLQPLEKLP